ncbi:hypothetical protein GCM10020216_018320 [Nonomuraea helvata]
MPISRTPVTATAVRTLVTPASTPPEGRGGGDGRAPADGPGSAWKESDFMGPPWERNAYSGSWLTG